MDREDYLRARGWAENSGRPGLWSRRGSDQRATADAVLEQRQYDREHTFAHGSVAYRPTAEQAQTSPLLAACAARGMCERDVIGMLFEEGQRTLRALCALDLFQPMPPIVSGGRTWTNPKAEALAAKGRARVVARLAADPAWNEAVAKAQAIGDAWKAHSLAGQRMWTAQQAHDIAGVRKAVEDIENASEDLRILGIDPDA